MENTVSTNAKAIADLKAEVGDAITKIEITLKEEQTKDNSSLIERLTIVQDATTSNQGRIESLERGSQTIPDQGDQCSKQSGEILVLWRKTLRQ